MFKLLETDGLARAGILHTKHGTIQTPMFMPVGTKGSVKGLTQEHLNDLGAEIILGNTYHLYLQPGADIVASHGGFAKMMHWESEIKTKQIKKSRCLNSAGFF